MHHQHPLVDSNARGGEQCLVRTDCNNVIEASNYSISMGDCDHCGSSGWNIIGDASTGFALTQDENNNCLLRDEKQAVLTNCSIAYSTFSLKCKLTSSVVNT